MFKLKMMKTVYGHRHLNFFFEPLFTILEDGFVTNKKTYNWKDVEQLDSWKPSSEKIQSMMANSGISPSTVVRLKDGTSVKINARSLEKKGKKETAGFLSGKTLAYDELVETLEMKVPTAAQLKPDL